jgi:sugar O-acyltransferase (sialic acid O-acetyltransferase NeuD family)
MNKEKLLLIGAGGHANSCIDVIEQEGKFEIAGLVGHPNQVGSRHFGYEVLGSDADLESLFVEFKFAIVTIGHIENADSRIRLYNQIKSIGFKVPSIKSKSAYVSDHAKIGDGTIVMHDAIINSGSVIGSNCIINTRSLIEHDVKVSDHCHVSTGVVVNGGVQIGSGTFIGSRSVIRDNLSIGDECLVGMGTILLHDLQSQTKIINK